MILTECHLVSPTPSYRSIAANHCLSAFSFVFDSQFGYNLFDWQPV